MKNILLASFSILAYLSIGQTSSSIGIMGSLDYTYRYIDTKLYSKESGKLNYRLGINYDRKISNRCWIEVGVRYASVGYKIDEKNIKWGSEYDTLKGMWIPNPDLPHKLTSYIDYLFIEIPVCLRYQLSKSKWNPYFIAGISPDFYINTKVKNVTELYTTNNTEKTYFFKKLNFSAIVGFGFDYAITQNCEVFGQPSFRYYFTNIQNQPIEEYLYSFGIELGVRKNL